MSRKWYTALNKLLTNKMKHGWQHRTLKNGDPLQSEPRTPVMRGKLEKNVKVRVEKEGLFWNKRFVLLTTTNFSIP